MSETNTLQRILLTGAAGGLGRILRESLKPFAGRLRLSDIAGMAPAATPQEELVTCDLADKAAVDALVQGCDAIVHLGGVSVERSFEEILDANIRGVFHVYEAARRHAVRRVVFASSNHVIGFYPQGVRIDEESPHRPDGYYGLSKAYGEDLARFYFDRYGIETVCIRIGSSFAEPRDRRMLSTWLSYRDLTELVRCGLFAEDVGFTVVYGVSDNAASWWDNAAAQRLGYRAQDSAEMYRDAVERQPAPAPDAPIAVYQGGNFCAAGPFETLPPVGEA